MNKAEEMRYSQSFITFLNKETGSDYKAIPNQDEDLKDSEVDVYAESDSLETLKLQVKIIDRDYMPIIISCLKKTNSTRDFLSSVHIRDLDPIKWAEKTIEECSRKYEPAVQKNLVLLLCVYHSVGIDQTYSQKQFTKYQQCHFKGIYLVNPPRSVSNNRKHSGEITPIKLLSRNFIS